MEMMPHEIRFVAICFDASGARGGIAGRHQVLLFVNDEEDRNEECFRIDLTVLTT